MNRLRVRRLIQILRWITALSDALTKERMKKSQSYLSLLMMMLLMMFFAAIPQSVWASDSVADYQGNRGTNNSSHAVPAPELHEMIQDFQKQVLESRKNIQEFLARPDIKTEINHAGGNPGKVIFQVSLLSDEEVINLSRQIMDIDLQKETVGGALGKIIGLILFALSIYLLVKKFS
jgi:hypothetical protein